MTLRLRRTMRIERFSCLPDLASPLYYDRVYHLIYEFSENEAIFLLLESGCFMGYLNVPQREVEKV